MYVCVLGIPKGKFSKKMKKKKLRYRIIRIKRIFSGVYWCITWTKSLTNLHKSLICLWVNWYRLYINKLRKNAFIPIINTGHKYLGILEYTCINTGHKYLGILEYTCILINCDTPIWPTQRNNEYIGSSPRSYFRRG
jgi:hypothetical protein